MLGPKKKENKIYKKTENRENKKQDWQLVVGVEIFVRRATGMVCTDLVRSALPNEPTLRWRRRRRRRLRHQSHSPRFGSRPTISSTSRPHNDHNDDDEAASSSLVGHSGVPGSLWVCALSPSIKPNDLCFESELYSAISTSSWTNLLIKHFNVRAACSAC